MSFKRILEIFNLSLFSSNKQNYQTPPDLFETLNKEFNFILDAAADSTNHLCEAWLGPGSSYCEDALACDWPVDHGRSVWMNPEYGRNLSKFLRKAYEQCYKQKIIVVCLIPARTDTKIFNEVIWKAAEVRLIQGRLKFVGAKDTAPFPSCIIVLHPNNDRPPRFSKIDRQGNEIQDI